MSPRLLLIPAALLAALALAPVERAEASPHGARAVASTGLHFGHHRRRVHVGARVGFPIGRRGGYYREVVEYVGGYHETRHRDVEVHGKQIGWDFEGKPLYAGSRIEHQDYQVWVPRRRIVRRVWVPRRARGYVTVGGRVRVR